MIFVFRIQNLMQYADPDHPDPRAVCGSGSRSLCSVWIRIVFIVFFVLNNRYGTVGTVDVRMFALDRNWTRRITRVADPVHFRPDPDPANQNFKNRIRILLALTKKSIQTSKFFSHQTYFFYYLNDDYFYLKKWKNSPEKA